MGDIISGEHYWRRGEWDSEWTVHFDPFTNEADSARLHFELYNRSKPPSPKGKHESE